jgi:hypothetical protein
MRQKNPDYFLPEPRLAARFRNRLKQALEQDHPAELAQIPREIWSMKWVVDVEPVGSGEAALKYLSAYVSRTALGNHRILRDEQGCITFKYKDSCDRRWRTLTVPALEFLRRFLQHVLPKGFQRIRYYGWLGPAAKTRWQRILALLDWKPLALIPAPPHEPLCSRCGVKLRWLGTLERGPSRTYL